MPCSAPVLMTVQLTRALEGLEGDAPRAALPLYSTLAIAVSGPLPTTGANQRLP